MFAYIVRRVLWVIPVLFFVSLITFALMHSVDGGPWDDGQRLTDTDRARLDARYGLDEPLWRQYLDFVTDAVRGDLGFSFSRPTQDVNEQIWEGFKVSFVLGTLALAVSIAIGMPLGVLSAVKRNGVWDYLAVFLSTAGAAIPSFVLGIFLIIVFAVELGWLPVQGWGSPRDAVLPVITLALLPMAYIARITRASVLEILGLDYIRTARAKGLGGYAIISRHVMRNALIPIVTVLGPLTAALITGSAIIESMFSVPGVGRAFVESFKERDYGMIMGTTLFYAVLVALANLAVDITYAFIDPRIRRQ